MRVHDAYSYERAGLVSSAYPRSHHRGAPPRLRRLLGLREHRSDPKPRRETWPWDRGKARQHRDAHPAPDSKSHPHAPSRQSSPTFQHLPSPTFSNSGRANVHSTHGHEIQIRTSFPGGTAAPTPHIWLLRGRHRQCSVAREASPPTLSRVLFEMEKKPPHRVTLFDNGQHPWLAFVRTDASGARKSRNVFLDPIAASVQQAPSRVNSHRS